MKVVHGKGFDKLQEALNELKGRQLRVGWESSAVYPNGDVVAVVAAQNEFGNPAKHIPPRPFMRPTITNKQTIWRDHIAKGAMSVLESKTTAVNALSTIGQGIAGDFRKAIAQVTSPALATATVEARLRGKKQGKSVSLSIAKPLVDTGFMLNSLTSTVQ